MLDYDAGSAGNYKKALKMTQVGASDPYRNIRAVKRFIEKSETLNREACNVALIMDPNFTELKNQADIRALN
jgi:hypothetical protein